MKVWATVMAGWITLGCAGCGGVPRVEIVQVPRAAVGGAEVMEEIAGKASGGSWGARIVIYAKSGDWWVQPFANNPYTSVGRDGRWTAQTHLGSDYAALLVDAKFRPTARNRELPGLGRGVLAVHEKAGWGVKPVEASGGRVLEFSGYEWETLSPESAVAVDGQGHLHLHLKKQAGRWMGGDVWVRRSLGYGTYVAKVRKAGAAAQRWEAATAFRMFTWDEAEAGQNHREMDIEISQWGDGAAKNAQFAVQPYYVPANTYRFWLGGRAPWEQRMQWAPGRVQFAVREQQTVAEYVFSSGVPTPGGEKFHLSLGVYERARQAQREEIEVVVEKFEFHP